MKQVGIFGKRKSGKSALMYALTRQKIIQGAAFSAMEISGVTRVMLVDTVGVDVAGYVGEARALTRQKIIQDAAFRAMEISGVTRVMLVDTVGVDVEDDSTAEKSAQSVEVALMLITDDTFELELAWISKLRKAGSAIIVVISKADEFPDGGAALAAAVKEVSGLKTLCVSSVTGAGVIELDEEINRLLGTGD